MTKSQCVPRVTDPPRTSTRTGATSLAPRASARLFAAARATMAAQRVALPPSPTQPRRSCARDAQPYARFAPTSAASTAGNSAGSASWRVAAMGCGVATPSSAAQACGS